MKCSFRGLACFSDGWGESITYSYADVIVRQWILSPFDLHTDYSFTLNTGNTTSGRVSTIIPIDPDNYLLSVQATFINVSCFFLNKK